MLKPHSLVFILFLIAVLFERSFANETKKEEKTDEQLLVKIRKLARQAGYKNAKRIGKNRDQEPEICYSRPCLNSAIQILEAINMKADPCDKSGFGEFACHARIHRSAKSFHQSKYGNQSLLTWRIIDNLKIGLQILQSPIKRPSEESSRALFNAKVYYRQCHNLENRKYGTKALWDLSQRYGGWPILKQSEPTDFKWENFAAFLAQFRTQTLVFDISPIPTENGVEILLDKGLIASRGFNPVSFKHQLNYTLNTIRDRWNETGADFKLPESFDIGIKGTMEVVETLQVMAVRFNDRIKARMTISELTKFTKQRIGWLNFFQKAYDATNIDIDEDTIVQVNKRYVEALTKWWHSAGMWESSLLQYELFSQLIPYTSIFQLNNLMENRHPGLVKTSCMENAKVHFGAGMSKEFLKRNPYPKKVKSDIESITDNVLIGLSEYINASSFLYSNGKRKLNKKFSKVHKILGYPEFLDHKENFTRYHAKLENFNQNETEFLGNMIKLLTWKEGVDRDGYVPTDDSLHYWELNKFIVDLGGASFMSLANSMLIPAPTTAEPIYSYGAPGYINYGALGVILGHELGHGMDPGGIFYDRDGNYKKNGLLGRENQENYDQWIDSIKRDFNKSDIHFHGKTDRKLNGELTIKDDVADIIGIQVAFNAYKRYLNEQPDGMDLKLPGLEKIPDEQLFFVTYANMWCAEIPEAQAKYAGLSDHSPDYNRAIVPLKRSKQFAETFQCEHSGEFEI